MTWENKRILVSGGNGFLGSTLVRKLNQLNPKEIVTPSSKDFDLRFKDNCETITKNIDIVFHLAAHVGGIGLNIVQAASMVSAFPIIGIDIYKKKLESQIHIMRNLQY